MQIVKDKISCFALKKMSQKMFGNFIKAVVDVEKEIMALDGELHSDEEELLLKNGSKQKNLWGINLYPEATKDEFVEFDSMINLRPGQKNLSRSVDNPVTRKKIIKVVNKLVQR